MFFECSSGRLAAGVYFLRVPGALGTLRFRQVSSLDPVIDIAVADRAQGFVVQADFAGGFAEFLRELMQGLQMLGGSRNLGFCGLEKLLVSLIDQAGDFRADQKARLGKETHAVVAGLFNSGRAVQLLHEDAVLCSWSIQNVEPVLTKPTYGFFVRALLCLLCHDSPVADLVSQTVAPHLTRRADTVAHPVRSQQHYCCAEKYPQPQYPALGAGPARNPQKPRGFLIIWSD